MQDDLSDTDPSHHSDAKNFRAFCPTDALPLVGSAARPALCVCVCVCVCTHVLSVALVIAVWIGLCLNGRQTAAAVAAALLPVVGAAAGGGGGTRWCDARQAGRAN